MATDFYRTQHVKIRELAAQLIKGASAKPANASAVRDILNQLSGVLSVHLTAEDHALYPRFVADSRPNISSLARRFQEEMGGLKKTFTSYVSKWTSAAIAAETDVFARETRSVVAALLARMDREDREFYPAIGV